MRKVNAFLKAVFVMFCVLQRRVFQSPDGRGVSPGPQNLFPVNFKRICPGLAQYVSPVQLDLVGSTKTHLQATQGSEWYKLLQEDVGIFGGLLPSTCKNK